ncbi:MAG: hypothetical protein M3Y82_02780, partial [Verrucomicrobiota bacterium]|nr:hypothetical protein [Verrucomicrobiota bacterium]
MKKEILLKPENENQRTRRFKFITTWLAFLLVLMASGAAPLRAQSALDGFDPNANDAIRVVVLQPDGKILLGGDFTTLAPNGGAAVTRNHIARLNSNGTLDTTFNPNANGSVNAIALQADGKILVGGAFNGASGIGGQPRNRIARLDPVVGSADSFNPNANGDVYAIAVHADGKILAGGQFLGANSIGGQTRNRIARLDPATGAADSFDPNANSDVRAIVVQADGRILAGGLFNGANSIGGQARNRIARLDPATGAADSFDPNASFFISSMAVQADGKILAGGAFTTIGGQSRFFMARLDPVTGAADSFNPNANGSISAITVQPDGRILVGGQFQFNGANSIGGATRNYIARLDPTTGAADAFNPNANGPIYSIAVQADGKILAGGAFSSLSPNGGAAVVRNHIARLEPDGRLDRTLSFSTIGTSVLATAVQADGKILIGGDFISVQGVTRNRIARLNTDGTLEAFNPNANDTVSSIAVQADGKILVGGAFNDLGNPGTPSIGGGDRNFIARLDPATGLADSFAPDANGTVNAIAVQADGKILIGGDFISVQG